MSDTEDWCMVKEEEKPQGPQAPEAPEAPAGVALCASDAGLTYAIKVLQDPQDQAGRKPLNIQVLFCLDVSSSMQGDGIKALQDMIRTMPYSAKELTHNAFFGTVAVFSSQCHVLPCAQHPEKISDRSRRVRYLARDRRRSFHRKYSRRRSTQDSVPRRS